MSAFSSLKGRMILPKWAQTCYFLAQLSCPWCLAGYIFTYLKCLYPFFLNRSVNYYSFILSLGEEKNKIKSLIPEIS